MPSSSKRSANFCASGASYSITGLIGCTPGLTSKPAAVAIVSAVIPYATIPTEIWLQRSGRLRGAWRLDDSGDPRDRLPIDRALRFFLRRPWALGLALVAVVAVVFVVLLIVGPPGGKG